MLTLSVERARISELLLPVPRLLPMVLPPGSSVPFTGWRRLDGAEPVLVVAAAGFETNQLGSATAATGAAAGSVAALLLRSPTIERRSFDSSASS